eukprot:TRINITY_DN1213_c1_g1_i2.p1 TRINITY_DN1213_c1_g1~~TRINITY_DN1213_c1_g1_i2.p1  ORF type:complete len:531 (+),score=87.69 TRINITY_DN1213_c1_g1_i2:74-1666(+)
MLSTLCAVVAMAAKPNMIFILADDLGYNEMGFMNGTRGLVTPHLDSLAHDGVIFKNYYVQPICSPTRSAFMTGRYTVRLGTQSNVIYWDTPWGISLDEKFIPQYLKEEGYDTAMFGKWHLGMFREDYMPAKRGFDYYEGYLQGCQSAYTHVSSCCSANTPDHDNNYTCIADTWQFIGYDWFNQTAPLPSANHTNSAYLIRDRAVGFIQDHYESENPFFLYLPFQNIHSPYTCDPKYRNMFSNTTLTGEEQTIWGYIAELDDAVGHVLDALNEAPSSVSQNTVIFFSSDNGAPPVDGVSHTVGSNPGWGQRNFPFRGHKSEIWEGGTRVAGFVHSPLLPKEVRGTVSHEHYHITDWLPTIVSLSGGRLPPNIDGHDIWTSVSQGTKSPRTEHLYNINPLCHAGQAGSPKAGLRIGDMKVLTYCYSINGIDNATFTGPVSAPEGTKDIDPEFYKGPVLYNLTADPSETTNLAHDSEYKQVLDNLLKRLELFANQSVIPMQWEPPFQGDDYFCSDCPKHPPMHSADDAWTFWL